VKKKEKKRIYIRLWFIVNEVDIGVFSNSFFAIYISSFSPQMERIAG
jgi:hypothetical protein